MKTQKIIYLLTLLLVYACSSLKKSMIATGEDLKEIAIQNAILDFSTNCSLFKEDSVFNVRFKDSVFNEATLERIDERSFHWKRGTLYEGIVSVNIIASNYQYYYSEETKDKLPSRHIIKEGKLFYWYDSKYPVTDEMVEILWKYNLLQEYCIISEYSIDEEKKGADYYFCKNDLSKYKRRITNRAIGYYQPPKLKCK